MEKQTSSIRQSSMFLIELMIAILFLSLCSAICIRLFINARLTANESYELTQSVTSAQNIAEIIEAAIDENTTADLETLNRYYDDNFNICVKEQAVYFSNIIFTYSTNMISADISILQNSDTELSNPIYTLHVDYAVSRPGGVQQ